MQRSRSRVQHSFMFEEGSPEKRPVHDAWKVVSSFLFEQLGAGCEAPVPAAACFDLQASHRRIISIFFRLRVPQDGAERCVLRALTLVQMSAARKALEALEVGVGKAHCRRQRRH